MCLGPKKPQIKHEGNFFFFYIGSEKFHRIHTWTFIVAGSEIWLELDLESSFPVDLPFDDIAISLTHGQLSTTALSGSDNGSEKSRRKVNRPVMHSFSATGSSGGPGIHRTPSNRSTSSVVSSAASSFIQVHFNFEHKLLMC